MMQGLNDLSSSDLAQKRNHPGNQAVRVRFAPSPTGFLHIGGVRTALFNWLLARRLKGKFLLRIEDTDLERSEQRFTNDILASMKWLGLDWDEKPIYQSQRLDIYRKKAEELITQGLAYRCTCTEADVEKMREKAMKEGRKPQYDRSCREKNLGPSDSGQPFVIRAKIPQEGSVKFSDLVRGEIEFANSELDDFVLVRSNGAPTYNLSVVVDDVESRVTHVLRGDDHINNTPKQIHLYQFFNYQVPQFAHLPMILGADKKKLSKRHGAVSAHIYRLDGYLPEALLNFLARLGWSHGDQEVFTLQEMVQYFSFDHVQKSSAVFNTEKLLWLNGAHLREVNSDRLRNIVVEDFADYFRSSSDQETDARPLPDSPSLGRAKSSLGIKLVALIQPKVKLVKEVAEQLVPLCTPGVIEVDPKDLKWNKNPALKPTTQAAVRHAIDLFAKKVDGAKPAGGFRDRIGQEAVWGNSPSLGDVGMQVADIEGILRQVSEQHGIKLGDLAQPMRLTVTGRLVSAGLFELLAVLPWDLVEMRLKKVLSL